MGSDFAGSHLELGIIRSTEGILRLANAGDTLVDAGSAPVALLGDQKDYISRKDAKIAKLLPGSHTEPRSHRVYPKPTESFPLCLSVFV